MLTLTHSVTEGRTLRERSRRPLARSRRPPRTTSSRPMSRSPSSECHQRVCGLWHRAPANKRAGETCSRRILLLLLRRSLSVSVTLSGDSSISPRRCVAVVVVVRSSRATACHPTATACHPTTRGNGRPPPTHPVLVVVVCTSMTAVVVVVGGAANIRVASRRVRPVRALCNCSPCTHRCAGTTWRSTRRTRGATAPRRRSSTCELLL